MTQTPPTTEPATPDTDEDVSTPSPGEDEPDKPPA